MKGHVLYALVYGRRAERASPQRTRKQMGGSWGTRGVGGGVHHWTLGSRPPGRKGLQGRLLNVVNVLNAAELCAFFFF